MPSAAGGGGITGSHAPPPESTITVRVCAAAPLMTPLRHYQRPQHVTGPWAATRGQVTSDRPASDVRRPASDQPRLSWAAGGGGVGGRRRAVPATHSQSATAIVAPPAEPWLTPLPPDDPHILLPPHLLPFIQSCPGSHHPYAALASLLSTSTHLI